MFDASQILPKIPKTIRGGRSLTKRRPTTTERNRPRPDWEALSQIGAVLIRTAGFGSICWLAIDPATADEIRAEEQQREKPCPVFTAEDIAHMESMSEQAIRGAIEIVRMSLGGPNR